MRKFWLIYNLYVFFSHVLVVVYKKSPFPGCRTYGMRVQIVIRKDFLGTRHSLLAQIFFISFAQPASLYSKEHMYIFFASVEASSVCIRLSCLTCLWSVVRGVCSRLFCGHNGCSLPEVSITSFMPLQFFVFVRLLESNFLTHTKM